MGGGSAPGRLADLVAKCCFADPGLRARLRTAWGTLELIEVVRPYPPAGTCSVSRAIRQDDCTGSRNDGGSWNLSESR